MLSSIVGQVDGNSALVLAVAIICMCIVVTSLIVKRRSRIDLAHQFELAKMKQQSENAVSVYQAETDRSYKFKQLDQGLITSHARKEVNLNNEQGR